MAGLVIGERGDGFAYFDGHMDDIRIQNENIFNANPGLGNTDTIVVPLGNSSPIANAGLDQMVHPGITAILDGSGSSDPDGNTPLTFSWILTEFPNGSTAVLVDDTSINPTLIPDVLGDYVIELTVTDSLGLSSVSDEVIISTNNTPPVADAGPDQAISQIGTLVQLDGSQSDDVDGDEFTYLWSFTSKPQTSTAVLDDPTIVNPTFYADVHADYIIQLVVTDEFGGVSSPDSVLIGFDNVKPVADAGLNQSVVIGESATLDGSASTDTNLDVLTYNWECGQFTWLEVWF